jgi:hypothetical protein
MSKTEKRKSGPARKGHAEHCIGLRVSDKTRRYLDRSKLGTTGTVRLALAMLRKLYPNPRSLSGIDLDADMFNGLDPSGSEDP